MGYAEVDPKWNKIFLDLNTLFKLTLEPGDTLFDFTNSPGLFHFILDQAPPSRYFHVSMALHRENQRTLISQLEDRRPKLVVFHSDEWVGLNRWDGITNMVRHYLVSQYLLHHYKPLVKFHGYNFFLREDLDGKSYQDRLASLAIPPSRSLYEGDSCDWGFVLEAWKQPIKGAKASLPYKTSIVNGKFILEITLPVGYRRQGSDLEIQFDKVNFDKFLVANTQKGLGIDGAFLKFDSYPAEKTAYHLPVASCSQWYGFEGETIFLSHENPGTKIRAVVLNSDFDYRFID